jgi:hypothetical protein
METAFSFCPWSEQLYVMLDFNAWIQQLRDEFPLWIDISHFACAPRLSLYINRTLGYGLAGRQDCFDAGGVIRVMCMTYSLHFYIHRMS